MVKYCKECGSELDDESLFCNECGTKIGATSSSPSPNSTLFSTYNIDMMDGETVIRHSQIHVGCLILPGIILALGLIIGFIQFIFLLTSYYPWMAFFAFFNIFTIVGAIWLVVRYLGYLSNDLILTNKRVFGKCGLISTTQMQSPLNKIDSVSYSNGIIGKIIGYGTVKIATTSTTFKFRFIREGQSLYNDIFNQLEASEEERRSEDARAIVDAMAEKLGD